MSAIPNFSSLDEARAVARVIFHRQYDEQIAKAIPVLVRTSQRTKQTITATAFGLASSAIDGGDHNLAVLWLAAAVESLDESPRKV